MTNLPIDTRQTGQRVRPIDIVYSVAERIAEAVLAMEYSASTEDLQRIAADDHAPVPALSGWRREVFGEDALALKHGKLALTARNRRIRIVPLHADEEPAREQRRG